MQRGSFRRAFQVGILSAWLLASAVATAQQTQPAASITGQVQGFANEPLADVTLIFHNLDRNQQLRLETDATGAFQGSGFLPGRYRIAILQAGHILWVISGVVVGESGGALQLDINLRELRRAAEAMPVLDVELHRRIRQYEEEQAAKTRLRDHYREGVRALESEDYATAVKELEAACQLSPREALLQAQLGRAYAGAGRYEEAIAAYERALALDSRDSAYHNNYGVALAGVGRTAEALAAFEQAARGKDEHTPTYYFNWGAALYNAGREAEASKQLEQATRTDPNNALAHYFLGVCLFRQSPQEPVGGTQRVKPLKGTVEAFQRYLELAPQGEYASEAARYLRELGVEVKRSEATPSPEPQP